MVTLSTSFCYSKTTGSAAVKVEIPTNPTIARVLKSFIGEWGSWEWMKHRSVIRHCKTIPLSLFLQGVPTE
jgi:hypothetical protein